jgi:hypothetical protein
MLTSSQALINRMLAYNYETHIGLVEVKIVATLKHEISHVIEDFRRATAGMQASGDTALWDELALANDQLTQYAAKHPDAQKRIIVISDGDDTKSTNLPHDTYWNLRQDKVRLDVVCLGDENNFDLVAAAYLLGCYRFAPQSLANALAICEMEPFLSLSERLSIIEDHGRPRNAGELLWRFRSATIEATNTIFTDDIVPPRREHPNLSDEFVPLQALTATSRTFATAGSTTAGSSTRSNCAYHAS